MSTSDMVAVLRMLGSSYPRYTLTSDTIKVYSELLRDIPIDLLKAAALQCVSQKDFFPSVHEIRSAAVDIRLKVDRIPTTYEAWEDLRKAGNGEVYTPVRKVGDDYIIDPPKAYKFLHPIVETVARQLGWPSHFPDYGNLSVDRAHFFKAYQEAQNNAVSSARMLPEVSQYIDKTRQFETENNINLLAERLEL